MKIITHSTELTRLCQELAAEPYITVDTEFLRDKTYWPVLCLIQVASPTQACIIDPLAEDIDLTPFYRLMEAPGVIKVFHAARQDIEIFFQQGNVIPDPLFDTQVAAMVCGFGDSVGYDTLVRKITGNNIDKTSRFTDWSQRPLSGKQLEYALADVTHLCQVYQSLTRQLSETARSHWVAEEMAILQNPQTYTLAPQDAWKRMKMKVRSRRALAVLKKLATWRETCAQKKNVPRGRILKDDVLFELASQYPRSPADLEKLRAVPKGFAQSRYAAGLLEAIATGRAIRDADLPDLHKGPVSPPGTGPVVEMLKVLLKLRCEEYGVASKLVATVADLERIAADDKAAVAALKGWRHEVFGEDALSLKNGKTVLGIKDKALAVMKL